MCATCGGDTLAGKRFCSGLPDELTERIVRQADGVLPYAVATVRMPLDRALIVPEGARYALAGPVADLDVPETLHALAVARLDGLTAEERSTLQGAAVFGRRFTATGVAALGTRSIEQAQRTLDGLVGRQLLGFNDDPRSSERGQYQFLQAALRATAYATLSRRDRQRRR